ncbi:hypothetical protein OG233_30850 (plasmid) [Streptomyces sp. NBC_01218]|uniref:hypothetical protein n=1 Tax=Streptomyces sp. NBC_01218 TaxID=2903780 RepID=UPI002E0DF0A0|nr:hypothetical protein OG233_30850 [Streptomyces sp. NBC_01218]
MIDADGADPTILPVPIPAVVALALPRIQEGLRVEAGQLPLQRTHLMSNNP